MAQRLSYQQTLRTLGTLLDLAEVTAGTIAVSRERAEVRVPGWPRPRMWDRDSLTAEVATQQRWRSSRDGRALPWAGRNSQDLRAVGRVLDARGSGPYTIVLAPDAVRVREADRDLCAWPRPA